MDKILFISENSKLSTGIKEQLEKSFEVECSGFVLNDVRNCIRGRSPLLAVAFVKELPYESHRVLHILLNSEAINFILIGSRAECHDFFGLGNIKKCILTPITPHQLLMQVEDISDEVAGRPKRFRGKDAKEEKMSEQKHILVVDDDAVSLRTVTNYLKDYYKVSVVKSGTAAISFLAKEIPDLILLDYEMPVCDGVQTLQMIRGEEEYKDIPVFFLTGVSDADMVRTAVDLKPEGYILKSTTQIALLTKIKEFFGEQDFQG